MTTETGKKKGLYWAVFLVSLFIMIMLLMFAPQWFWLSLPTTVGGLALSFDLI